MRGARWMIAWCVLSACATTPRSSAHQAARLDVPFYRNDSDQCGPAALASVLNYWNIRTSPESLRAELYRKSLSGTLPLDLFLAAKRRLPAQLVSGDLSLIKREIDAKHPVVALLNLGTSWMPVEHFVVVVGFDDGKQGVYLHSGRRAAKFMSYGNFLRSWKRTDYWTLRLGPDVAHHVS